MTFEGFWLTYPRKLNKTHARKKYDQAIRKGFNYVDIIEGARSFRDYVERNAIEQQFVALAATWLHQERWLNDYSAESFSQPTKGKASGSRQGQVSVGMAASVKIVQKNRMETERGDKQDDSLDFLYLTR